MTPLQHDIAQILVGGLTFVGYVIPLIVLGCALAWLILPEGTPTNSTGAK